jgi:hypothetical protein
MVTADLTNQRSHGQELDSRLHGLPSQANQVPWRHAASQRSRLDPMALWMEFCVCPQHDHSGTLQALRAAYECVSVCPQPYWMLVVGRLGCGNRISSINSRLLTEGDVELSDTFVLWIMRLCSLVDTYSHICTWVSEYWDAVSGPAMIICVLHNLWN